MCTPVKTLDSSAASILSRPNTDHRRATLYIEQRSFDDIAILDCAGRIVFREETEALFEAVHLTMSNCRCVLLNLSGVHRLDSGGLGMLVLLHQFVGAGFCQLKICGADPQISELITLTKLNTLLDLYATENDAIASFFCGAA